MIRPESMSRTLALLVLCFMVPGLAFANAGQIIFAQGEVVIVHQDGERTPVDTGEQVEEGDRIKTGAEARAQIRLSDGALISLRANSDYQILAQNTEEGLMEQAGKLFSGWMRTVTGAIGEENPEAVEQETPVATIGIRGTTYQAIHMPKGGIPGIPESEPGTYIYLQQGRIETTAGGETRFMEPGDVVFVPIGGGVPVPAPDKKSLFSRGERGGGETDTGELLETSSNEGREDLESTDSLNDSLDQQFPPFNDVLVLGSYAYADDLGSQLQRLRADRSALKIAGTGSSRRVTEMAYMDSDGFVYRLQANASSASPQDTGYHVLPSGAEINWGVWQSGDYSEEIVDTSTGSSVDNPTEDWHYMIGNEVLGLDEIGGLAGTFNYNYVGGTQLSRMDGTATAVNIDPSSRLQVDFDNNQIRAEINFNGIPDNPTGLGSFAAFYDTESGINLFGGTGSGSIDGAFMGENAEGAMTNIEYSYNTETYHGTAAFEKGGETTIPN